MRSLFLILTLVASTAFAQVDAVIQGPAESLIGDLVVLNSGGSVGDNKVWMVDPAVSGRTIECADTLAFAVGTPGRYEFTLVVADKNADIDFARHVVTIRASSTIPPPVDPDPNDPNPTDPPPVVPPDTKALTELSRTKASALSDNATATALADSLKQACETSKSKTLTEAKASVSSAFEATMLARVGSSRDKDWLRTWRMPINEAIDQRNPTDTAQYLALIVAVEHGLRNNSGASQPAKVVMYSRPGCIYCDRWERTVMPILSDAGWTIEKALDLVGEVPTFEICAYGQCVRYTGYMDVNTFSQIVASLNTSKE